MIDMNSKPKDQCDIMEQGMMTDVNPDFIKDSERLPSEMEFAESSFSKTPSASHESTSSLLSNSGVCGTCGDRVGRAMTSCLNSRTKRILVISSIFSLCFVIGTIIYVVIGLNQLQDNYNWVVHTDTVKVSIGNLYSSIINAESAVREYVITGLASELGPYNTSIDSTSGNDVWTQFYQVSNLTIDNPIQIANCVKLQQRIVTAFISLNQTLYYRTHYNFSVAASYMVAYPPGVMSNIFGLLNNMTWEESSLLTARENRFQDSIHNMTVVLVIVLVFVAVSIVSGLIVGYGWDTKLLKSLNNRLRVLLEQAREGTLIKNLFLANISHEIRTPMNGVLAMTQLLSSMDLPQNQRDVVEIILLSAETMMRLINDLLMFSKLEAGKFIITPEWLYLPTFLASLTEIFTVRAHGKKIEYATVLDSKTPKYIYQDSGRLRQILINLCDNSIKFTSHGEVKLHITFVRRPVKLNQATMGVAKDSKKKDSQSSETKDTPITSQLSHAEPPRIQHGCEQQEECGSMPDQLPSSPTIESVEERYYIVFTVTDSGIGMAPSVQRNIFEPFQQADSSTTREYGGTGLGLSISSQLVKSMGGRLKVRSQLGVGSVFEFGLPITADQLIHSVEMESKNTNDSKDSEEQQVMRTQSTKTASGQRRTDTESIEGTENLDEPEIKNPELDPISNTELRIKPVSPSSINFEVKTDEPPLSRLQNATTGWPSSTNLDPGVTDVGSCKTSDLRILLVEDNPVNQKVAKRLLEREKHMVVIANNGQEGLDFWSNDQIGFDLILMDLQMPVMDGLTATQKIRQIEAKSPLRSSGSKPIPIVALTASALPEDDKRCLESGFNDIIHKPLNMHLLSKKMREFRSPNQRTVAVC